MINLTIREQLGLALALYQEGFISGLRKVGDRFVNPGKIGDDISKAKDKVVAFHKEKIKDFNNSDRQKPSKKSTVTKLEPNQDPYYHRAGELDGRPSKTKPVDKPDPNKKSEGFTGAHAIGATMLATGVGLGAHSLYKKWKKKKKEKELRNKKY
jgi:hypothetical protein